MTESDRRGRAAFPDPAGSAGAAHFAGASSVERSERVEALRAQVEERAHRVSGAASVARRDAALSWPQERSVARDWPRPPSCLVAAQLDLPPEKALVTVCGLVIVRQRPGSAKGVLFVTLEDETGVVNVVVWTRIYETFRRAVIAGRLLRVTGRIQRDGKVVHVVAERIEDVSHLLDTLADGAPQIGDGSLARADEVRRPNERGSRPDVSGPAERARRNGVARGAPPRAMHPREQARHLFRRPPGLEE